MKHKRKPVWWRGRPFWAAKGVVDLLLAYAFGSWAIDTGRYWFYIATLFFTWAGVWFLARAIKNDRK